MSQDEINQILAESEIGYITEQEWNDIHEGVEF